MSEEKITIPLSRYWTSGVGVFLDIYLDKEGKVESVSIRCTLTKSHARTLEGDRLEYTYTPNDLFKAMIQSLLSDLYLI